MTANFKCNDCGYSATEENFSSVFDECKELHIECPSCFSLNITELPITAKDIPIDLEPLFEMIGYLLTYNSVSGIDNSTTIASIINVSRRFFINNPETLHLPDIAISASDIT